MKTRNGKTLISIILLSLSLLPSNVYAIGQTTDPIDIKNALREKTYTETITVVNTESTKTIVKLAAEGDIAGWTRFYKSVSDTDNINDIEVPSGAKAVVIARFIIPAGTPNGIYRGYVSVSRKAGDYASSSEDSGSSVSQKIDREVTVEVNDTENVIFDTSLIPETYDLNQGETLKIRIIHDNRGNIEIRPQLSLKIKQDENILYSAIFPYPDNQPGTAPYSLFEIPALEIPTTTLQNGKYEAVFNISEGEKYSIDKDFTFSVGMVKAASTTTESTGLNGIWGAAKLFLSIVAIAYIAFLVRSKIIKKQKVLR